VASGSSIPLLSATDDDSGLNTQRQTFLRDTLEQAPVWGDVKLVVAEKKTDEDEESPVKYLATNKIDAPTQHVIRSYRMRWRIETFFVDSKQDS
jgi:hypothetical protein